MKTKVAVVIPSWNGRHLLEPCLESLRGQSTGAQVIVVDNGSDDGTIEFLKNNYPEVLVVPLGKNYGFTGGVNKGIERARALGVEFVALLNNDAVADNDWLKHLLGAAEKQPRAGIITGKLMIDDREHIDSTGESLSIWGLPFSRGRNELDRGQYDDAEFVFAASGGASLYRMKMLDKIGLFDDDYFAYFEDVDISFRAQLAGWQVYYQPRAIAYHAIGATSAHLGSFARYHSTKNIILLYNRNMPGGLFWKYKLLFFGQLARMLAGSIVHRELGAYLRGFGRGVLLFPKTLGVRRRNQRHRKVSPDVIDQLLYHHRPPKPPSLEKLNQKGKS